MGFQEKIQKIDEVQKKIDAHGKFSDEIFKKINYKIRLDWNYYSNKMEGGTLTQSETRSVMAGVLLINNKPKKDVYEMEGHNKIVEEVLKMGKGERRISESRIKEIHKAVMHETNEEKEREIGRWKLKPNEVINYRHEKYEFTKPEDVENKIHELLNETNAELDKFFNKKISKHPIELAAEFHLKFINIHPFYDGNGRTARILTNIILLSCGYPVIIIKDNQKEAYYQLLADIQVYGGNPNLFYSFIADRVADTQQLIIDIVAGKEIEDEDIIDKEIMQLKAELGPENNIKKKVSVENITRVIQLELVPLFNTVYNKYSKLKEYFFDFESRLYYLSDNPIDVVFIDNEKHYIYTGIFDSEMGVKINNWLKSNDQLLNNITLEIICNGYKKSDSGHTFHINIHVNFNEFFYSIEIINYKRNKYYYGSSISDEDKNQIVKHVVDELLDWMKTNNSSYKE